MKTQQELKALFPKLLPGKVHPKRKDEAQLWWKPGFIEIVQDNQLLSLCREVEEILFTEQGSMDYYKTLKSICKQHRDEAIHASWEQRIEAAAEVKGIV